VKKDVYLMEPVRIVRAPDPEYPSAKHDHLWVLVGGKDDFDGSRAFYLGPNRDIDGDDLASNNVLDVVSSAKKAGLNIDRTDVEQALDDYRRSITGAS
jgi:hypothetical protein